MSSEDRRILTSVQLLFDIYVSTFNLITNLYIFFPHRNNKADGLISVVALVF